MCCGGCGCLLLLRGPDVADASLPRPTLCPRDASRREGRWPAVPRGTGRRTGAVASQEVAEGGEGALGALRGGAAGGHGSRVQKNIAKYSGKSNSQIPALIQLVSLVLNL